MKRALTAAVVLVAVAAVLAVASLPPAAIVLDGPADGAVPGVVHVHTDRSDGLSSPDEVAAAAARAGLSFLVFTDHGNGTRPPDPPTYRSGVLCLDGVEISTAGGHYVAIGLPVAPYPLGGEARDVVEDVRRLGGLGFAAHPDSTKPELQWADWTLPFDGVELLNLDTVWRRFVQMPGWTPKRRLLQALLAYPIRPEESIGNLLSLNPANVSAYADLTSERVATALLAVDAHSKVALRDVDPGDNRWALPFPGYGTVFGTLQIRATTARPLTGDATVDANLIIDALRAGALYGVNMGLAGPPRFEFTASRSSEEIVGQGSVLPAGEPATLRVRSNAPPGFETILYAGSDPVVQSPGQHVELEIGGEPGVYRAEIRAADRAHQPIWIVSNPIYVQAGQIEADPELPGERVAGQTLFDGGTTDGWRVEHDEASRATLALEQARPPVLTFDYGLGGGPATTQFAALVVETPGGVASFERLRLTISSDRPARVSVQARAAVTPSQDDRWVRSIHVDENQRTVAIDFTDMRPLGPTETARPRPADIHSFVFAMELTNTAPGTTGTIRIERVELER